MTKFRLSMSAFAFFVSASAWADVTVIKTQVNGQALQVGKNISVMVPTVTLGGNSYRLEPSSETADAVCRMLDMEFLSYAVSSSREGILKQVFGVRNSNAQLSERTNYMQVVTCKAK